MPTWCQRGPVAPGDRLRARNTAPARPLRPRSNAQAAFTNEAVLASLSDRDRHHQRADIDRPGRPAASAPARRCSGVMVGKSPCRFTTTSCRPCGSSSASAACTRSEPRRQRRIGQHRRPPAARTASAISGIAAGHRDRPDVRLARRGRARARSSAGRGCRPAACRAAAWRPCGRG